MTKLADRILAFGGTHYDSQVPSTIAEFDLSTSSWKEQNQKLQSSNTSELIVTEYPISSLDCIPECRCGIAAKKGRVFGGSESEVRMILFVDHPFQAGAYPWVGALLRDEDIEKDYINSKCSVVLVSTTTQ